MSKTSKHGFIIPDYEEYADIPLLIQQEIDVLEGIIDSIEALWDSFGVHVYDGGGFGVEQIDAPLDGGLFEDEDLSPLDCGGFESYVIPSDNVVDGGTY